MTTFQAKFEAVANLQRQGDFSGAIRKYKARLKKALDSPANWKYDVWATILGTQGHQSPHIHRSDWLSGCYYDKIPKVMESRASGEDGWIEFGRPQDYPHRKADPIVRTYKPYEGMVVLFPSYFYHCTIPFSAEEERISIAFDIVPVQ